MDIVVVKMLKRLAHTNINPGENAGYSAHYAATLVEAGIAEYLDAPKDPAELAEEVIVESEPLKKKGGWRR